MPPHPPPKPLHEKHGPDQPPKPPHEKPGPHPKPKPMHKPPHEKGKEGLWKKLGIAFMISSIVTALLAFTQYYFGITINVILPVSAAIWVGLITVLFMALSKLH